MPRKKKIVEQKLPEDNKIQAEPPKNLLPEHAETKDEPKIEVKLPEAEKKTEGTVLKDDDLVKDPSVLTQDKKPEELPPAKEESPTKKEEQTPVQDVNPPLSQSGESQASVALPAPVAESLIASPPISVPLNNSQPPAANRPPAKALVMAGSILAGLLFLVIGIWTYNSQALKNAKKMTSSVKSAEPTTARNLPSRVAPTKVATDEVKLNKYPVRVLNGSGIAGEATKVKNLLEKEGFQVSQTGNADNFDYTDTLIRVKKNVEKSFTEKLKEALEKSYSVSSKDETISASDSSNIVVIVGSTKSE